MEEKGIFGKETSVKIEVRKNGDRVAEKPS
jgi:hypothetical protein